MHDLFCQELRKEVQEKEKDLEEARKLCKKMCDGVKESSAKFDLKNKLANVERPYEDLKKKLGEYD